MSTWAAVRKNPHVPLLSAPAFMVQFDVVFVEAVQYACPSVDVVPATLPDVGVPDSRKWKSSRTEAISIMLPVLVKVRVRLLGPLKSKTAVACWFGPAL